MEFKGIDVGEMERQRYNYIKKSGEYLELTVLIGSEGVQEENVTTKQPIVVLNFNECNPEDISCLHSTLCAITKKLEQKYPIECIMSKLTMSTTDMGEIELNKEE